MAIFDKLFANKKPAENVIGERIRNIRIHKKITVKDLSAACGVNENSIRNYELGIRQVGKDKLELIADCLGVPLATLRDRGIYSYADVMHTLFELSDGYEFIPVEIPQEPRYALLTKDTVLVDAIRRWYEKRREWEQKKITLEDLKDWEDAFPNQCQEKTVAFDEQLGEEAHYTDFERIISLKMALEQMQAVVESYSEQISDCLKGKDMEQANQHLELLQRTVRTLVASDIKKYG